MDKKADSIHYSPYYRIGRYEGAIKSALIALDHANAIDAAGILRRVLAQTEREDAVKAAEKAEGRVAAEGAY
jgi:hypothetical protein